MGFLWSLWKYVLILSIIIIVVPPYLGPIRIGASFMAKRICSSKFVAGAGPGVEEYAIALFKVLPFTSSIDMKEKSVSVRWMDFGLVSKAVFCANSCLLVNEHEVCEDYEGCESLHKKRTYREKKEDNVVRNEKVQSVLNERMKEILPNGHNVNARGLVVRHNGKIIAEKYDENYPTHIKQHGWSMTKSVLNVLIGKRVAEKKMTLSDRVVFPKARKRKYSNLTIHNLLDMASGIDWVNF